MTGWGGAIVRTYANGGGFGDGHWVLRDVVLRELARALQRRIVVDLRVISHSRVGDQLQVVVHELELLDPVQQQTHSYQRSYSKLYRVQLCCAESNDTTWSSQFAIEKKSCKLRYFWLWRLVRALRKAIHSKPVGRVRYRGQLCCTGSNDTTWSSQFTVQKKYLSDLQGQIFSTVTVRALRKAIYSKHGFLGAARMLARWSFPVLEGLQDSRVQLCFAIVRLWSRNIWTDCENIWLTCTGSGVHSVRVLLRAFYFTLASHSHAGTMGFSASQSCAAVLHDQMVLLWGSSQLLFEAKNIWLSCTINWRSSSPSFAWSTLQQTLNVSSRAA